jgi:hypothetical protein
MATDMADGLVNLPMGRWPYKYSSDMVELRHPAILQAGPTAYRGVHKHNGDLLFLNVTNNYVTQMWKKLMVCIKVSSQEVIKTDS